MKAHRTIVHHHQQPVHTPNRTTARQLLLLAVLSLLTLIAVWFSYRWWLRQRPLPPLAAVATVAGTGPKLNAATFSDPFGVAADDAGNVFVSDGLCGCIYRIAAEGQTTKLTGALDMPSGVALAPDGSLVVADTGAHTIVRVDAQTGQTVLIAGATGASGNADGPLRNATFNGPIGIAVGADGAIFVADTYNDSIRVIGLDGQVRTLAGGRKAGFSDGQGAAALFDTPCGLVVAADGSLFVADTGNHRIRHVRRDGAVTTLPEFGEFSLYEPTALALRRDNSLLIADAASVQLMTFGAQPKVTMLAGGEGRGLLDGELGKARFNGLMGLACAANDAVLLADGGNGLVRALVPEGVQFGFQSKPEAALLKPEDIRAAGPPRWPFEPPVARREIAGTFGEVRGEILPEHDAWFHNGLDIPGAYGEQVRAIFAERVTRPIAIADVGTMRERLRLPLLGYIHMRAGRDQNDQPLYEAAGAPFLFQYDEAGQLSKVRVRRGARFNAGAALGTLNALYHVHLIAGPASGEVNALAALELPGLRDTVPPVIESVTLTNANHQPLRAEARGNKVQIAQGRLRIIVRGYDQADGNAGRRRLGIYRLGYQLFNADSAPAADFAEPRFNIVFDRLPDESEAVRLAYAEGSQSGYAGATVFAYLITNVVRGGVAREDFFDTAKLAPGAYTLRVLAEDFFGNRTQREMIISVN